MSWRHLVPQSKFDLGQRIRVGSSQRAPRPVATIAPRPCGRGNILLPQLARSARSADRVARSGSGRKAVIIDVPKPAWRSRTLVLLPGCDINRASRAVMTARRLTQRRRLRWH